MRTNTLTNEIKNAYDHTYDHTNAHTCGYASAHAHARARARAHAHVHAPPTPMPSPRPSPRQRPSQRQRPHAHAPAHRQRQQGGRQEIETAAETERHLTKRAAVITSCKDACRVPSRTQGAGQAPSTLARTNLECIAQRAQYLQVPAFQHRDNLHCARPAQERVGTGGHAISAE
eukprot:6182519-Pleurochrysis_carterae.AAC.11